MELFVVTDWLTTLGPPETAPWYVQLLECATRQRTLHLAVLRH